MDPVVDDVFARFCLVGNAPSVTRNAELYRVGA